MNWEDFKKAIKEKPWILGLLIVGAILIIYLVLKKPKEETYYETVPQVIAGGGIPIGGGNETGLIGDTLSKFAETQKESFQRVTETMQSMLTGFTEAQGQVLTEMAESQKQALAEMAKTQIQTRESLQNLMESITKSQSEILSKITQSQQDMLKQFQAGMQEVKAVKENAIQDFGLYSVIKTPEKTFYATPVTTLSGGVGGGYAVTETPAQMAELLRGGSRNVGGSYTLDYRGWEPAPPGQPGSSSYAQSAVSKVTGKSGSIESQLSGMTTSQKLETLKKAGLI